MNTVGQGTPRSVVHTLLEEANSFPTSVWPIGFHGLYAPSDERGADGKLLLQFYAGLAILTRDMHLYLQAHPHQNAAAFESIVEEVQAEERQRWHERAFPLYQGIPAAEDLSLGLAEAAAAGRPSLESLGEPAFIHEWSTRPGALIYTRTMSAVNRLGLHKRVCGKNGYYQQYRSHQITAPDMQEMIVTSIIALLLGPETVWVPWAVLATVILVRRSLKRYCGGSPPSQ